MAALRPNKSGTSASPPLAIEYQNIDKLTPASKNARVHSKKQIQQLARSIQEFGCNVPVLVNPNLQLIAGHGRLAACKLLGITQVPTIRIDHLTERQVRAFMIADNRLAENVGWNRRRLGEELKELSEIDLGFPLEITGFSIDQIDMMIEGVGSPTEAAVEGALPKMSSSPVTKVGDLWLLEDNRVLCGDALDSQCYEQLMNGRLATAVFANPPYHDSIDGLVTGFGKVHRAKRAMVSGTMTEAESVDFLSKIFANLKRASAPGSIHLICIDWRQLQPLLAAAERTYAQLKNTCIWLKDSGTRGSLDGEEYDLVFVFTTGITQQQSDKLGKYRLSRSNFSHYPGVNPSRSKAKEPSLQSDPTAKPVALVADAISDCSGRGEIVLDPFLGSGTTVIAAHGVGRICYGIEFDPACVDLAIRRWQAYTGGTAQHATSKRSFDELEIPLAESR